MHNYKSPAKSGYTVYSISGCKYCDMCMKYMKDKPKKIQIINCDMYINTLRNRDDFFKFMSTYTVIPYVYFPMIFYNGKFIGGYKELTCKEQSK